MLALVPLLGFVWWLVFPLVFGVTPDGVFDTPLGFMTIDTFWESFYAWIAAAAMALLWWFVTPQLVRAKARMDANLLSRGRTEQPRAPRPGPADLARGVGRLLRGRAAEGSSATCTTARRPGWSRWG